MTTPDFSTPSLQRVPATALLVPGRLDLAVKARFFRHLAEGGDPDAERLYRWHIEKRTGGREPRSWKRTVNDYVTAARQLLAAMRANGFDPATPLEYGANGRLRDGAHRLSLALLLGLDVWLLPVPIDGNATWGEDWFRRHGVAALDLARIWEDWQWLRERPRERPQERPSS